MSAQVFTGRYQIERQVARGGMAEVFLARDLLLDRPVALKVLFPEFSSDQSFVERFRREARAAANLNHPNIVSIYDWGEENGTYFIVMEYVDGRTLREVIRSEGPLAANRAAEIGAEIASALHFAHLNGVVHRDVKPGNVMISARQVKVTDFGIARAGDPGENLTQTGAVMGTATYFSPEQAQGHNVDLRSDVYSLGVVLYEMVTARPPFTGDNPVSIAYQHVREEPVPPSEVNPKVPKVFDAIVAKAMAKSRETRYPSAEALRADLLRFNQGRTMVAPSPPTPLRSAPANANTELAAAQAATAMVPRTSAGTDNTRTIMSTEVAGSGLNRPARNQRTSAYIVILVVLLAILGGLLLLLARELGVGRTEKVAVPPVVGLTQEEATTALEDAGLSVEVVTAPDDVNEAGRVTAQDPAAEAQVERDSKVKITVSAGAEPVAVPDVRRKSVDAATDQLRDAGFEVNVTRKTDDSVDADIVIDQTPLPGTQVGPGTEIELIVSAGPEQVEVPELRNQLEGDAANRLGQLGFGTRSRTEPNNDVGPGRVIRTEPDAGTPLDSGSTVTLVVSSGPTTTAPAPTTTAPPIIVLPTIFPTTSSTVPATTSTT